MGEPCKTWDLNSDTRLMKLQTMGAVADLWIVAQKSEGVISDEVVKC